jgi:hypothetical protein
MTFPSSFDVARGIANGVRVVHRFGRNPAIGSTFTPVTRAGFYRTPTVSGAVPLRIKAGGNAADTANGAGAQAVMLTGIDATGELISETISTAGASASLPTSRTFMRLMEAIVTASGTYATQSARSHVGTITIENAAGTEDWAQISDGTFPRGASEIGVYTIPKNRSAYVQAIRLSCDADKKANVILFKRSGILQTLAPYSAMVLVAEFPAVSGQIAIDYDPPLAFPELTDFGFMASIGASTVDITVSFDVVECIP